MSVDLTPDSAGLSAVAGSRPPLTVRQKLGIVGLCGAVALTAILLGNLFGAHHKSDADKNATDIGVAGLPFTAPPEPAPRPVQPPAPVPVSMSAPPRTIPTPQSDAAAALDAPIMSYSSNSNVAAARRLADAGAANGQTGVDDPLSRALKPSDLGAPARASLLPHPTMTIPAGTVIPCTLQTAINSQLAGFVDCVLPSEVRGATGSVTLLDRGTQIFGEIRSALQQGQDRLFILWVRARTPQNVVISLASPAADELGRAGVPGAVDNHWWSRFGAAILFSVIGAGPEIASSALQNGNGNNYFQFLSPQQQLADTVLQAQINIPPTLEKNQGDAVSIFVARDLDFATVYDVRPTLPQ
jgi:type IV secretion system protein VirB10